MITSLQKVRERLGLTELEVGWDQQLTWIIGLTLERFNLETMRRLQRTVNHIETFDAGEREVSLECYPVEAIAKWEVWANGQWQEDTEVQAVARRGGVMLLDKPVGERGKLARVTYTGGYVLPDPAGGQGQYALPEILEVGAIETVAFWFGTRLSLGYIRVEGQMGDYKELADVEWVPWVRSMLRKFRRMGA
jgi:hypothetical protein